MLECQKEGAVVSPSKGSVAISWHFLAPSYPPPKTNPFSCNSSMKYADADADAVGRYPKVSSCYDLFLLNMCS